MWYLTSLGKTFWDLPSTFKLMIFDKKNEGSRINFVLLEAIGRPVVDKEIDRELFIDSFKYYNNSL